ncbi:MAG: LamG domain-containing protein [Planctomycetes bacterium]|nr:LamG domain-containing protein [Planctomycetota bacterium]
MKHVFRHTCLAFVSIALASSTLAQNQCLELDGVFPSMVEIPSDPSLDLTGPYTLELWGWADTVNPAAQPMLVRRQESNVKLDYSFGVIGNSQFVGHHNWSHGIHAGSQVVSNDTIPIQQWFHIAFTFDPSTLTSKVFLNGIEVGSNSSMEIPWNNVADIWFGAWDQPLGAGSWDGRIDELRIWSVVKSGAQILADMNLAIHQHQDLVSVWHFDGDATDAVGANHGAVLGGALFVPSDAPIADDDEDDDGLLDLDELVIWGTNPNLFDTDGDGLGDGQELGVTYATAPGGTNPAIFVEDTDPLSTTDPLLYDSDTGGASDGNEDIDKNGAVDANESDPNASQDDLFQMSVQGLSPNQQATISVWDCHPGFVVVPLYSLAGQSSNVLARYNQLEIQLTQPVTQLTGMVASAGGNAFSVVWVPPFAPIGRTVYWQSVEVAPGGAAYRPSIPLITVIQ